MRISFDPAKNQQNIAKHGVSLGIAKDLDWASALVWQDDRQGYGETRMSCLALIGTRLYFTAFTDRGETRRIITLRKANAREVRRYVSEI